MTETAAGPQQHRDEQEEADRFGFGGNWLRFLETVDEERVEEAVRSLRGFLGQDSLAGVRMLDLGSGSGLFSLAAVRLGAAEVHSVDFDDDSVRCTAEIKRRFAPDAAQWTVEQGDATDGAAMAALGRYDLVYSWGVLHHTGQLWRALDNACAAVAPGGRLFISIYNDQGLRSRAWTAIKRTYVRLAPRELASLGVQTLTGHAGDYVRSWTEYQTQRGMSRWHDLVDWVGGYPFEVAKPEEIFDRCKEHGFRLERLTTAGGGLGCNQFLFAREGEA